MFDGSGNFGRKNMQSLSPAQLGIGNVQFVKFLNFPVLQSALTLFTLLGLIMGLLCTCVCVVTCLTYKQKSFKKYFRPTCGVAKQWASDMSDVFVFFPCKGVYFMLHYIIVVPFQQLLAFGSSILVARTTRLQQKLMQEAEGLQERPKAKAGKQQERKNGNRTTPTATALTAKKVQQKPNPVVERKKESEASKASGGMSIGGNSPIIQPLKVPSNDEQVSEELVAEDSTCGGDDTPGAGVDSNHSRSESRVEQESPTTAKQVASEPCTLPESSSREASSSTHLASVNTSSATTPETRVQSVLESCDAEKNAVEKQVSRENGKSTKDCKQEASTLPAAKATPPAASQWPSSDVATKKINESGKQPAPAPSKVQHAETPKVPARKVVAKETKEASKKALPLPVKVAVKTSIPSSRPQSGETPEVLQASKKSEAKASEPEATPIGKKQSATPPVLPPPPPRPAPQEASEGQSKAQTTQSPEKKAQSLESDTASPPRILAGRSTENSAGKAKMAPPPFPPPGLMQPTPAPEEPTASKAPLRVSKPDAKPSKHNKILKVPHNLGPPPPGPAPAPPMAGGKILKGDGIDGDSVAETKTVDRTPETPTKPSKIINPDFKVPGSQLPMWSTKSLADNLRDNGTLSGGTGCTVDFGSTSEKVIELMTQKAHINHTNMVREQQGKAVGLSGQEEKESMPGVDDTFDHASLEAMVEDLVGMDLGASPFFEDEEEDDVVEKDFVHLSYGVDVLPAEVEVEDPLGTDSGLRNSAPAFVPGQMWTGSQRSAFID